MFNCPRCLLRTKDHTEQLKKCAFCRIRAKAMRENTTPLPAPTDRYPAGKN